MDQTKDVRHYINLKTKISSYLIVSLLIGLSACQNERVNIELASTNVKASKSYVLDYGNAFENGFVSPSIALDKMSAFKVSYTVSNFDDDTLYYKLFFQNESYKFPNQDPLAHENFYGCSLNSLKSAGKVERNEAGNFIIEDSLIINGNPRDEKKYYGLNHRGVLPDTAGFYEMVNKIKADATWYNEVKGKAEQYGLELKEQLRRDALWVMNDQSKHNNRWQRNLRVGQYSLLLVVFNKKTHDELPGYILNTGLKKEEEFVNPYGYFLNTTADFNTSYTEHFVTLKADVPLTSGIYIPYKKDRDTSYFNSYVGNQNRLYSQAAFQWQETTLHDRVVENVPVKAKFLSQGYTKEQYTNNILNYEGKRMNTFFVNTEKPGYSFGVDTSDGSLWFKNPYYENEYRKENVGVKTRHGFAYGKYTFKIKMANLLTKDNVWTGLTNALWLVMESQSKWNNRRTCEKEGFMPFYGAGEGEQRVPKIAYSEIDFEILKTVEVWPKSSYLDKTERFDPASHEDKVMVACTNWDMACKQPENFGIGVQKIQYEGEEYYPHRWNEFYNALTAKSPQKDSELFSGEHFFFQIEWKPNEIIWRIGPSKKDLRVVCYMSDKITTIPNNQMVAVITQEYHFAYWWPGSPFKQGDIPFPGEDLKGNLYSLEIE